MSNTTNNYSFVLPTLNDAADITAMNENWQTVDAKMLDKTVKILTDGEDLNNISETGWYAWHGTVKNLPTRNYNLNYMRVYKVPFGSKSCIQELFSHVDVPSLNPTAVVRRWIYNGDAYEWEWVNPPLDMHVDYLTTERYNGDKVYAKLSSDGIVHKVTHDGVDITPITFGTYDLSAGDSALTTGQLYFVYE